MDGKTGSSVGRWFSRRSFGWFAGILLGYNLLVILWGAYVRVSFSGDGCGANWPSCNGSFVPHAMAVPMAIEYTHRLMTSLDTFGVIALGIWAFRIFPRRHAARRYAVFSFVFLLIEALLGAGLVIFRLVARDASAGRVLYLGAHLTNTLLLLASISITAWVALRASDQVRLAGLPRRSVWALLITIVVSITGTIAALGDTLFPSTTLAGGLAQDFSSSSHFLLRLRLLHPALAVAGAAYLAWISIDLIREYTTESVTGKAAVRLLTVTILQVLLGAVNLGLLAPLWAQLTHLLMADLVWIAAVLLALETMRVWVTIPVLNYEEAGQV